MSDVPICVDRGCHIEIHPRHRMPDGFEILTRVLHREAGGERVRHVWVDPDQEDERGMISPHMLQALAEAFEDWHRQRETWRRLTAADPVDSTRSGGV